MNGDTDSDRKRAILSFLRAAKNIPGAFPSSEEIQAALRSDGDVPPHIIHQLAQQRLRKGEEEWADAGSTTELPILSRIPAEGDLPTEAADLGKIPIDLAALKIDLSANTFALRVRGDAMAGACIMDGDLVVIETREPIIGEVVAAVFEGETMLRRFVMEGGEFYLKAEHGDFSERILLDDLSIRGVVRAVVRVCGPEGERF